MLGVADKAQVIELFETVMAGAIADALRLLEEQYNGGADPAQVLQELAEFTHLVTRIKVAPDTARSTALTPEESRRGQSAAERLSLPALSRAWQILSKGIEELRGTQTPLAAADMVLVRLAHAAALPTPDEALRRLGFGLGSTAPVPAAQAPSLQAPALQPAPRNNGSSRATQAAAAAPAPPTSQPARAPNAVSIPDFPALVALAAEKRDMLLKIALESQLRLVRFELGRLEFELAPGGDATLANTIMQRLQSWTGERWIVSVVKAGGAPTLTEQREAKERERRSGLEADPLIASVLAHFPGAQIVAVRGKDSGAVSAQAVDAEVDYDDGLDSYDD